MKKNKIGVKKNKININNDIDNDSKDLRRIEYEDLKLLSSFYSKLLSKSGQGIRYSNGVTNILDNLINFDIGFEHALVKFKLVNHENDLIELKNEDKFLFLKDKLSELIYLDSMVALSGLDSFRQEILSNHIDSMFSKNAKQGDSKITRKELINFIKNLN